MSVEMNKLFDHVYNIPQAPGVVRDWIIPLNDTDFNMDEVN